MPKSSLLILFIISVLAKKTPFEEHFIKLRTFVTETCKKSGSSKVKYNGHVVERDDNQVIKMGKMDTWVLGPSEGVEILDISALYRKTIEKGEEYESYKFIYNIVTRPAKNPFLAKLFASYVSCQYKPTGVFGGDDLASVMFVSRDGDINSLGITNYRTVKTRFKMFRFFKIAELFRDLYLMNMRMFRIQMKDLYLNKDDKISLLLSKLGEMVDVADTMLKSEDPSSSYDYEILTVNDYSEKLKYVYTPEMTGKTSTRNIEEIERNDIYNLRVLFYRVFSIDLSERNREFCLKCDSACGQIIYKLVDDKTDLNGYEDIMQDTIRHLFVEDHRHALAIANHVLPVHQVAFRITKEFFCTRSDILAKYQYEANKVNIVQPGGAGEMYLLLDDPGKDFGHQFLDSYLRSMKELRFIQHREDYLGQVLKKNKDIAAVLPAYKDCVFDETHIGVRYQLTTPGLLMPDIQSQPMGTRIKYLVLVAGMIQNFQRSGFYFLDLAFKDIMVFLGEGDQMFLLIDPEKMMKIYEAKTNPKTIDRHLYCQESIRVIDAIPPETMALCAGREMELFAETEVWNFGRMILKLLVPNSSKWIKKDNNFFLNMVAELTNELKSDALGKALAAALTGCFVADAEDRAKLQTTVKKLNEALQALGKI